MQVNVQKLSPVLVEFDVQVGADRVRSEVDKAYSSVIRTAKIRGFRPGKAPRKVVKTMYGARIASDVAQRLVDATLPEALSEQKMQPLTQPSVDRPRLVESEPYHYKARFEVIPEIDSVSYDGLTAKRPKVEVTDEEIQKELEQLRQAHSTVEPLPEPRPAQEGDVVTIDFSIEVNGTEVPDAGAQDFQVELGSESLLKEIDEALRGKQPGEKTTAQLDMPAGHPHPKLAGQTAEFQITLKDIKHRVLPELDDELAKDAGEFETLDELKADIKKQLEANKKESADNAVAEQLVRELANANAIPVPPSLVNQQSRVTEQEILGRARSQGQQATDLGDELREKIRADSELKVRAGLLMAEIAKKEGIKIGDPEIEEGLKELSEQTGKNIAKLRVEYRDPKKREMLMGMILENKVLDIVEQKAKIEEEQ